MKRTLYFLSLLIAGTTNLWAQTPSLTVTDHHDTTALIEIDCNYDFLSGQTIQLTAVYPAIYQTNSYTVESIPHSPVAAYTTGTLIEIEGQAGKKDDVFGDWISLPFEFCFYGTEYNNITISDNGVLSFESNNANGDCPFLVTGAIPNAGLPKNSIFGVFHDMQNNDEVRIHTQGTAPYRQFIVNYNNILQYGTLIYHSTSQIVLYETTNRIEVYVKEKSLNPDPGIDDARKRGMIGLTNVTGDNGLAAPDRNSGLWEVDETTSEAWAFVPSGINAASLQWFNSSGGYVGSSNPLTISPTTNTSYTAKVTYNLCSSIVVEDEIDIEFSADFPTANNLEKIICLATGETGIVDLTDYETEINPDATLSFSYHSSATAAQNNTSPIANPEAYTLPGDDSYVYVRVLRSGVCFIVGQIRIRVNRKPNIPENQEFTFCDYDSNNQETINLNSLSISGISWTHTVKFYATQANAIAGTGEITNTSNYLLDISSILPNTTKTLYIRAWNSYNFSDPDCFSVVPIQLTLSPQIEAQDYQALVCYVTQGQTITLNLTQYTANLLPVTVDNVDFDFYRYPYYSQILNPVNASITLDETIYVRISAEGYCDAYVSLTIIADDDCDGSPGLADGSEPATPEEIESWTSSCGEELPINVNLETDFLVYYLPTGLTLADITVNGFYLNSNQTNPVDAAYEITQTGSTTIYASYTINSSSLEISQPFNINATEPAAIVENDFYICDVFNDITETVYFSTTLLPFFQAYYPTDEIYFFASEADLDNFKADEDSIVPLSFITITTPVTPVYVLAKYFGCKYEHIAMLHLIPMEEEAVSIVVCDFDSDQQEIINLNTYTSNIASVLTPDQANAINSYSFYTSLDDARTGSWWTISNTSQYSIATGQMTVYVRVEIANACPVIVEMNFSFSDAAASPGIGNTHICDTGFDNVETINLNTIIASYDPNSVIDFYTSETAAENQDSNFYIGTFTEGATLNYQILPTSVVYIRATDTVSGCIQIVPVSLELVSFPMLNDNQVAICDEGNDNYEEVLTSEIQTLLIANNGGTINNTMAFVFFESQTDALANENPITEVTLTGTSSVWVHITTAQGDCFDIFEISVNLVPSPVLNDIEVEICNNSSQNNNNQISEYVVLNDYRDAVLGFPYSSEYTFSYYTSEADALNGGWGISSYYNITEFPKIIYTRVVNITTGCYSVASITINEFSALDVQDTIAEFCAEGQLNGIINLEDYPLVMVDNPDDYTITYHTTKNNAIYNLPITDNINEYYATPSTVVWIKFTDNTTGCFVIKQLLVSVYPSPKMNPVYVNNCDTDLDSEFTYNLNSYKTQWITGEPNVELLYIFQYYPTLTDAENETNEIPASLTFDYSDMVLNEFSNLMEYTVYVKAFTTDGNGCFTISRITFQSGIKVPQINDEITMYACEAGELFFDLTSVSAQISTEATGFVYYTSLTDAQNNTNPITNPTNFSNQTAQEVFIRTTATGFCDNLARIHIVVAPIIEANDFEIPSFCEFTASGEEAVINLNSYIPDMSTAIETDVFDVLLISFHESIIEAENNENALADTNNFIPPVGNTVVFTRFYNTITQCFTITELSITKLPAPVVTDVTDLICDDDLNDVYDVILGNYDSDVTTENNVTLSYHRTNTEAWDNLNSIDKTSYFVIDAFPKTLFVRTQNNTTGCVNVSEITFTTNPKVTIQNSAMAICDESDDDGLTQFDLTSVQNEMATEDGVAFVYYTSLADAQNDENAITDFTSFTNDNPYSDMVFVRISAPGFCDNLAQISLTVHPYIKANDFEVPVICEFVGLGAETTLNLNSQIPDMATNIETAVFDILDITFHESITDAQNDENALTDTNNFNPPVGNTIVFVRFENPVTLCFTVKELSITKLPAPAVTDVTDLICDDDLNNIYDVILGDYDSEVTTETDVTLSYHHTHTEAWDNLSSIDKTTDFVIDAFPKMLFVRTQNNTTGCANVSEITFTTNPKVPSQNSAMAICDESDDDGLTQFDLTSVQNEMATEDGVAFVYYTSLTDAQNDENAIADFTSFTNDNPYSDVVFVRISAPGFCDNLAQISLTVHPYIKAVDFIAPHVCEFTGLGEQGTINLNNQIPDMAINIESDVFDILNITFHESLTDAQNDSNAWQDNLLTDFNPPIGDTVFFVRFENPVTQCFTVKELLVTKFPAPVVTDVTMLVCDDDLNYVYSVMLGNYDSEITSEGNVSVSYHTTETFAWNGNNGINKANPYNINSFPRTLFVRTENNDTGCANVSQITFITNSISVNNLSFALCDQSDDNGLEQFDLTPSLTMLTTAEGASFTFFSTLTNAQNNTNPIGNISTYTNLIPYADMVYVRVSVEGFCDKLAMISLTVHPYIPADSVTVPAFCEFTSQGIPSTLNLNDYMADMIANTPESILDLINITLHINLAEAQQGANALTENEINDFNPVVGESAVFVRFENPSTLCATVREIFITKLPAPEVAEVSDVICDDDLNGIHTIILGNYDMEVTTQNDVTVSYHPTVSSAWDNTDAIDKTTDFIIAIFPKTLYVRTQNNSTSCVNVSPITFTSNPVNSQNVAIDICDENDNNGLTQFDLMAVQNEISTQEGVSFAYYPTLTDAQNNTGAIANLSSYTNANPYTDTVYVRVSADGFCDGLAEISLTVHHYLSVENHVENNVCHLDENGNIREVNLFDYTAPMTQNLPDELTEILTITYYGSEADADNQTNAFTGNYPLVLGNNLIYVRFENTVADCFETAVLEINTVLSPIAHNHQALVCDEDLDWNYHTVLADYDNSFSEETNLSISYYSSYNEAVQGINSIDKNAVYPLPENGNTATVYVRVENTNGCFVVVELILEKLLHPNPDFQEEYVLCMDSEENVAETLLSTGLSDETYIFEWYHDAVMLDETSSSLTVSQTGVFTVVVIDRLTLCEVAEASTTVFGSGPPENFEAVIVSGHFSGNGTIEASATGNGDYVFWLNNGTPQSHGTFTNVPFGQHYVYVQDLNGCGTEVIPLLMFNYPKFFTPNADGVHDTWNIPDLQGQPDAIIFIYDRYGKLITSIKPSGAGWDGTLNGQKLFSTDYWFEAVYYQNGQKQSFRSHFSLVR